MRFIFLLILIIVCSECTESSMNIMISQTSQEMLKTSFINLVVELRKINSSAQNNQLLSARINDTYNSLVYVTQELSVYNNVVWGANNMLMGDDNIILGSYDNIIGNNNFVFVSRYSGEISGDLIIENWKVEFDKRALTLLDPNLVVSTLTQDQIISYGKYTQNYQPSIQGILCLVKDIITMTDTVTGQSTETQQLPESTLDTANGISKDNSNPIPVPNSIQLPINSNPSIPLSTSLIPQILTPTVHSATTNLRSDSIQPNNNPQFINLSLSLLNKSWLPF